MLGFRVSSTQIPFTPEPVAEEPFPSGIFLEERNMPASKGIDRLISDCEHITACLAVDDDAPNIFDK